MHFCGRRLGRAHGTVKFLGRGEVGVSHDHLESLGGDTQVDQPLGTATTQVMGTGVLDPLTEIGVGLANDDLGIFADEASDSFLRQPLGFALGFVP